MPFTFNKTTADGTTAAQNFRHLLLPFSEVKTMLDLLGIGNDGVLALYVVSYTTPGIAQPLTTIRYVLFRKAVGGALTPLRSDFQNITSINTALLKSPSLPSYQTSRDTLDDFVANVTRARSERRAAYLPFFIQQNAAGVASISMHAPYLKFTGGVGAPGGEAGKQSAP